MSEETIAMLGASLIPSVYVEHLLELVFIEHATRLSFGNYKLLIVDKIDQQNISYTRTNKQTMNAAGTKEDSK